MDIAGADYVYLSDACSQDVLSLWSDEWSVGDPVSMPGMNCDDEFNDVFPAELVQSGESCDDNGDWLSDVLVSACPNTVAGYVSQSCGSDEHLLVTTCAMDCDSVLSPTDSGHHSIASSTTAQCIVADAQTDADDCSDTVDEYTSELNSQLENNADIHLVAAVSHDVSVNSRPEEIDETSTVAESEFIYEVMSQRPQRVAARRAEIALAREGSDCDDRDDDDDDDEVQDTRFRKRCCLYTAETSRRGRSRTAEVNRNALNARVNRQKKKAYMASLEAQKARLLEENKRMKSALSSLVYERDDLVDEVKYLKSVLANDSVLAKLVQNINGPPLKLSSRFDVAAQKRKDVESDHSYGPAAKLRASDRTGEVTAAGICLHVSESQLSMELCHHCARMADRRPVSCFDS